MIKTIFNSFGRTLGRILCYILLGIVIAILAGFINVKAATTSRSDNFMSDIKYLPSYVAAYNWTGANSYTATDINKHSFGDLYPFLFKDSEKLIYPVFNSGSEIFSISGPLGNNGRSFVFNLPNRISKDMYTAVTTYICYSGGNMPNVSRIGAGDSFSTALTTSPKYKSTNKMYFNSLTFSTGGSSLTVYCGAYFSIIQPTEQSAAYNLRMDGVSTSNITYFLLGLDVVPLANADIVTSSQIESIVKNSGLATASSVEEVNTAVKKVQEESEKINNSITSDDEDDTSQSCGIICKLKSIVSFLKPDHLINIIVPTEKQMNDLLDDTTDMIATKIGILGLPMTVYTQFIKLINNTSETDYCMTWDAVHVPNFEEAVPIIAAGNFCFSSILQNEKIATFRTTCMTIIGGLILFAFVAYLKNSYNKIFDIPDREEYTYFTTEDTYTVDDHTGEVLNHKYSQRKTFREKR